MLIKLLMIMTLELWIEISEEVFDDFSLGRKHFHEYKIFEDIQVKGKMHFMSTSYDDLDNTNHNTGLIQRTRTKPPDQEFRLYRIKNLGL